MHPILGPDALTLTIRPLVLWLGVEPADATTRVRTSAERRSFESSVERCGDGRLVQVLVTQLDVSIGSRFVGRALALPRPISTDLSVERDVRVPMDDGITLLADIYTPTYSPSGRAKLCRDDPRAQAEASNGDVDLVTHVGFCVISTRYLLMISGGTSRSALRDRGRARVAGNACRDRNLLDGYPVRAFPAVRIRSTDCRQHDVLVTCTKANESERTRLCATKRRSGPTRR